MSKALRVILAVGICAGLVTGCTVFPTPEPPRVMDLANATEAYPAKRTHRQSLRVDTPDASEPYNSSRILTKPTPWEFRIYEDVRWRDIAPVIVRDLLVHRLRQSGGFPTVVSDTSLVETDWAMVSELTAFHTRSRAGAVEVIIELHAQVIDNDSRKTVCTENFRVEAQAAESKVERVVEAFGTAGAQLSLEVTNWASDCAGPKG